MVCYELLVVGNNNYGVLLNFFSMRMAVMIVIGCYFNIS